MGQLDLPPALAAALRRALRGMAARSKTVSFVDADGDNVCFSLKEGGDGRWLEVEIGAQSRRVLKLALAEDGKAVRFLSDVDALQVNVTEEVVERGDLEQVRHLSEAAGLLPGELREPLLKLAYEFIMRRGCGGR